MITIVNKQRSVAVDTQQLKKDAHIILDALKYADFDLGILLTTPKTIQAYNNQYRSKDKPTDILSFAYHDTLKAGQRIKVRSEEDKNLGDLIICPSYVKAEAAKLNVTLDHRMKVLLVHGICHLLGYDHEKDADYRRMHTKETALLKRILSN